MAGISFIYEEYKKDPKRIEKLLEGSIEISEKLDGSRFQVQAQEGSELLYFKRKDVPISKIDRTLSKYYEKAVMHFDSLSDDKVSQLPDGWRFGMEYFPNLHPVTISYDKLPLNNLVLTDIQVKDPKDRTIDIISDKATLQKWSSVLEVEAPPIIFEGLLTDSQKKRILDFLNTPYNDLISRFKTESFTSFILKLLNPELKTSFMHDDLTKDIDGLIFRFDGKEAMRVSNPEINIRKQERPNEKPSDIYNLTLVFLQEFITSLDFNKIKLKEKTFESRYIEFICQVYNKFLQTSIYTNNFKNGVDFELPSFLTREESGVNFQFVKDLETAKYLSESNTNKELFKILLASMRSHKRRPSGFFSKELIYNHNELVDKIADYISNNIKESSFYSFQEFKSVYLTESDNWQDEFGKETYDDIEKVDLSDRPLEFPSYDQIIKTPELDKKENAPLEVLKKMFTPDEETETKTKKDKRKEVCVMKGKFHPFHSGHYAIAEDAAKESSMKVILVVTTHKLPDNKMSRELHSSMLDEIVNQHPSIQGYVFSDGRTMNEIELDLPVDCKVGAFAGSPDECEDIQVQKGGDFKTIPMSRHASTKQVLQKIKNEDYTGYKKMVPKSLHNFFYKIKNELDVE
jgi:hypothetical protein